MNVNCLILEKVEYNNSNYLLAVVLNETELTEEYVIFKEILENNEKYVEKVEDVKEIEELLKLFTTKIESKVNEDMKLN